jgi:type I restriction enzyme S subunit
LIMEIVDGETALASARTNLVSWRHALVKAAVTGELTSEWRKHYRPNATGADVVSSATELKGQFGVRSNRSPRAQEEDDSDFASLPEIPEGWVWAKLSDFARGSSYGTSVKCAYDANGVAVLRIPNIKSGRIELTGLKRATHPLNLVEDDFLDIGDLLIVRTNGSEDLIGRGAMVDEALPDRFYFASYLIRFRIVDNVHLRRWIGLYLQSVVARAWVSKNIASSAGQYNISQTALMRMPIPVPPELEMTAALHLFSEADIARGDAATDTQEAYRASPALRQAILCAAFEGRLVQQARSDESAERLLGGLKEQFLRAAKLRGRRRRRPITESNLPLFDFAQGAE